MAAAMNSRRLMVRLPTRCGGNLYRQAIPLDLKPPRPDSETSDMQNDCGMEKVIRSMRTPLDVADRRNRFHNFRSLMSQSYRFVDSNYSAFENLYGRRDKRYCAEGIMKPTWFNLPINCSISFGFTVIFCMILSMSWSHTVYFGGSRKILNWLVSITQPRMVFLHSNRPSPKSFRIDTAQSRLMNSSVLVGQKTQ